MRKGKARIVIGIIMIALQIMSMVGNSNSGNTVPIDMTNTYSIAFSIGYYAIGLIGLLMLIWGIVAFVRSKGRTDNDDDVYNYYHDNHNK